MPRRRPSPTRRSGLVWGGRRPPSSQFALSREQVEGRVECLDGARDVFGRMGCRNQSARPAENIDAMQQKAETDFVLKHGRCARFERLPGDAARVHVLGGRVSGKNMKFGEPAIGTPSEAAA